MLQTAKIFSTVFAHASWLTNQQRVFADLPDANAGGVASLSSVTPAESAYGLHRNSQPGRLRNARSQRLLHLDKDCERKFGRCDAPPCRAQGSPRRPRRNHL